MSTMMYREAISAALAEEMRRDEKVFVMGEDVAIVGGVYKATKGLLEEFGPQRVRNTPLSELAIMGTATGAAMCGARPVAEIMHIDFIGCGFDILLNQMSKMRYKTNGQVTVPLVIRTQCGHSLIVLDYNEDNITILDGNGNGKGLVAIRVIQWNYQGFRAKYIIQPSQTYFDMLYGEV